MHKLSLISVKNWMHRGQAVLSVQSMVCEDTSLTSQIHQYTTMQVVYLGIEILVSQIPCNLKRTSVRKNRATFLSKLQSLFKIGKRVSVANLS